MELTDSTRYEKQERQARWTEVILPRHSIVQTLQPVLRVGCVACHQIEIVHLECYHTALVVVFVYTYSIGYAQRLMLSKYSRATIAFFIGIVPITLVAIKLQVKLSCLHLGFLQTEKISIQITEYITKPLSLTSPEAINVPTYKFHTFIYLLATKIGQLFENTQKKGHFFIGTHKNT